METPSHSNFPPQTSTAAPGAASPTPSSSAASPAGPANETPSLPLPLSLQRTHTDHDHTDPRVSQYLHSHASRAPATDSQSLREDDEGRKGAAGRGRSQAVVGAQLDAHGDWRVRCRDSGSLERASSIEGTRGGGEGVKRIRMGEMDGRLDIGRAPDGTRALEKSSPRMQEVELVEEHRMVCCEPASDTPFSPLMAQATLSPPPSTVSSSASIPQQQSTPARRPRLRHRRSASLPPDYPRSHSTPPPSVLLLSPPQSPTHRRSRNPLDILAPRPSIGLAAIPSNLANAKVLPAQLIALHTVYSLPRPLHSRSKPNRLQATSLSPPITRTTLKELDLNEILRNPQLRHDVVHDPSLMFRPNHDGQRGDRKRLLADQYWTCITREIDLRCRCTTFDHDGFVLPCLCFPVGSPSISHRLSSRIGPLVLELRNILLSLLPTSSSKDTLKTPSTRDEVSTRLDPVALESQVESGSLDLVALASFVGSTLKLHCAPMRDELVDEMMSLCESGAKGGISRGLRLGFEILELMKLDIANHQLRSLRPYLLQTALDFETRSLLDSTTSASPLTSHPRTRSWLLASSPSMPCADKLEGVEHTVRSGLLDLIFTPSPPASLPETLQLDAYRLASFHTSTTDLTIIHMLLLLFQQLALPTRVTKEELETCRVELSCLLRDLGGRRGMEDAGWREGMKDVLLQVGARVRSVQLRASRLTKTEGGGEKEDTVPNQEMIQLLNAYFSTNLRSNSPLFLLLQSRLKSTLSTLVEEGSIKDPASRSMIPMDHGFREGWEGSAKRVGGIRSGRGGCRGRNVEMVVPKESMASLHPVGTSKRVRSGADEDKEGGRGKRRRREGEELLKRNGLEPLEGEVRVLAERIAKVVSFHLQVYQSWYLRLLDPPIA